MKRVLFCTFCAVMIVVAGGSVVAWLEVEGKDGKMTRSEDKGITVYTPDGPMSVQIMLPTQETQPENGPLRYEQSGYEAYYGT